MERINQQNYFEDHWRYQDIVFNNKMDKIFFINMHPYFDAKDTPQTGVDISDASVQNHDKTMFALLDIKGILNNQKFFEQRITLTNQFVLARVVRDISKVLEAPTESLPSLYSNQFIKYFGSQQEMLPAQYSQESREIPVEFKYRRSVLIRQFFCFVKQTVFQGQQRFEFRVKSMQNLMLFSKAARYNERLEPAMDKRQDKMPFSQYSVHYYVSLGAKKNINNMLFSHEYVNINYKLYVAENDVALQVLKEKVMEHYFRLFTYSEQMLELPRIRENLRRLQR